MIIIKKTLKIIMSMMIVILTGCAAHQIQAEQFNKASGYNALLGAEYLRKGRLNLANEKLKQALKQNPNSGDAHHYYALLQQKLKQDTLASKHFKMALKAKPSSELSNNYGSFLCHKKHYVAADKQFQIALDDPLYRTPEYAYANAGVCAMDAGNAVKAKMYFTKALQKRPQFPSVLLEMAGIYNISGDYSRAQAYLFRYNEQSGDSKRSLELCKVIHRQLGELDKVEECASKLLKQII